MKKLVKTIIIVAAIAAALGLFSSVFVFDPFKLHLNFFGKGLAIDKTANVITEIKKISELTTACFFEEKIVQETKYRYHDRKIAHKEQTRENLNTVKASALSSWGKLKDAASSAVNKAKQATDSTTLKDVTSAVGSAAKDIAVAAGSSAKDMATESAPALKDLVKADEVRVDSTEIGKIIWTVTTKVRAGYDLSKIAPEDLTIDGDTLKVKLPTVEIFDIIANPSDWHPFYREGNWEDSEIRAFQSTAKEAIREDAINAGLLEKAESCGKDVIISLFKTFGFSEIVLN